MARIPSEKVAEAEKLYRKGVSMADISKKLGVSDATVRSWKARYGWSDSKSKKTGKDVAKSVAKKNATGAATSTRKRGAQPGNKNAIGSRGNPHPPDPTKHGGYKPVYMDALDDNEKELLDEISTDPEQQLIEEIQLYSIRERRIMRAIAKYRNQDGDVAFVDMTRIDNRRKFSSPEEEEEYRERIQEDVASGNRLPGEPYTVHTRTEAMSLAIARLEQELSTVQGKKNKAIDSLYRMRIENAKIESESTGGEAVDDWISSITGGRP